MRFNTSPSYGLFHFGDQVLSWQVDLKPFPNFACVLQVQQISERLDTEVCNVRMPGRSKYKWEQKKHVWFVTWGKWATEEKKKLDNSPSFGGGSYTMRYSATWLSMCWAATMCCPSWLVWICWAGPDGLLKALPYGIPETLHSPCRHTQTLNCYSCYRGYHYHCCYSYASFSLSMSHIVVLLWSKMFDLFRRLALSLHFRGTVCVPLDVLLLLYFHVFSGLSFVLLFSVYVQLRQNVPCSTQNGAVPLPAADLLAQTVSTPKQCEKM